MKKIGLTGGIASGSTFRNAEGIVLLLLMRTRARRTVGKGTGFWGSPVSLVNTFADGQMDRSNGGSGISDERAQETNQLTSTVKTKEVLIK